MWNTLFFSFLISSLCQADVSHLKSNHAGYASQKPNHRLELPGEESTSAELAGYPKEVPKNPLQIPIASTANVQRRPKDSLLQGTNAGGIISAQLQTPLHDSDHSHHHHHNHNHHYHGEDGKYNPHDDGRGWDIRKSVPGEPELDYPAYDSVPTTHFTCKDKVPGYYADEETRCQVFRICTTNSLKTYNSFLCPNGSLFNQRVLTCDWWMNVDCELSSEFYYKNNEIGKMPEGVKLMQEVSKMLEAPNKNPYYFSQQQMKYLEQTIADNQIQGTGTVQDVYLPAKQPIVSTTKKYYTPTIPTTKPTTTSTTTRTTTIKPTVVTQNVHRINTNEKQFNLNQQSFQNVVSQEKVNEQTLQNVKNQYIPPQTPTIDQFGLSNVKTQQKTQQNAQVGEIKQMQQRDSTLHVSPILETSSKLHVSTDEPILHLSKLNNDTNKAQPLFISQNAKQDNKLFTSELSDKKDNQLFVSQVAQKQPGEPFLSETTDNESSSPNISSLFVSQLTPNSNAHALYVSQILQNQNGNVFLSQMLQPQPFKPAENQLFTSQLTMTNNAQPLFASSVAMKENKLFTSLERTPANNQISLTSLSISQTPDVSQPPKNEKMDQLFLSQIGQSSLAGVTGFELPKQTPVVSQEEAVQNPSLTVTKEQTHTVTHSEKTTHVFQNVNDGPEISVPEQTGDIQQPEIVQQSGNIRQNIPNINIGSTAQVSNKQQGGKQQEFSNVQQQNQANRPQGFVNQQRNQENEQDRFRTIEQQQLITASGPTGSSYEPTSFGIPELTKDQAFQQIDSIQSGFQQLTQQNNVNQFGQGIISPRINDQFIPQTSFGANLQHHQQIQPNFGSTAYASNNFNQNKGFEYQQPHFHEQNIQSFNFHNRHSSPNFNVDVSRGGSAQNYRQEAVSQHSHGYVHSSSSGHNTGYKETTTVDIIPSISFHLNDENDKKNFIYAILNGLIEDTSSFPSQVATTETSTSFLPFDVRYSSYHGPSSYLVPQMSVQRLPSDSGYFT